MIKRTDIRKIILEELIRKFENSLLIKEQQSSGGGPWVSSGQAGGAKRSMQQAIQISKVKGNAEDLLFALEELKGKSEEDLVEFITGGGAANLFFTLDRGDLDAIMNAVLISENDAKIRAEELIAATLNFEEPLTSGAVKSAVSKAASTAQSYAKKVGINIPNPASSNKPLIGLGTDEDKIKTVINYENVGSQLSFSRVCYWFKESNKNPDGKTFYDVFQDELDVPGDEEEFVLKPLRNLPFIQLKDDRGAIRPMTLEQLIEDIKINTLGISPEEETKDLDFGLEPPYIKNIIKTMNAYAKRESLGGYQEVTPVDKWNDEVQDAWIIFAPHVLNNCDLYSNFTPDKIGGVTSWPTMSSKMRSTYPGYTPNPRGCLAFCLDGYYCDLRYGDKAPAKGGGGGGSSGGSGGGSGGGSSGGSDGGRSEGGGESRSSSGQVQISLNQTKKNFKESGFTLRGDRNPDNLFIGAILNQMRTSTVRKGYGGGTLNIYFNLRGKGDRRRVTNIELQRGRGQWEGFDPILRNLKDRLEDIAKGLIFPTSGSYSPGSDQFDKEKGLGRQDSILATVTIPSAGDVNDLRP